MAGPRHGILTHAAHCCRIGLVIAFDWTKELTELRSMPRRLLDRCNRDSIREYRAAARQRFNDALAMAGQGRRTGAIYLWGYTAEMILKAAYFSVIGLSETHVVTWHADLRPAINRGRILGIAWPAPGEGHNVRA